MQNSIYFHHIVIEIFRPFLEQQKGLETFSYAESDAHAVFVASTNQLRRYVRDYRAMFDSRYISMFWIPALIQVGNSVIEEPADPDSRYLLDICIDELISLGQRWPMASMVLEGLLSMATKQGILSLQAAGEKLRHAKNTPVLHNAGHASIDASTLVFDRRRALVHRTSAQIDALSRQFHIELRITGNAPDSHSDLEKASEATA